MHFFSNLFWYRTPHVSDRFTVHHEESSIVYTAIGICHTVMLSASEIRILNVYIYIYRVICKSLRDFRPLRCSSRDGHAEGKHVNRGRDTPKFPPYLTGARYVHPWTITTDSVLANSKIRSAFFFPVHAMFRRDCPLAVKPASATWNLVHKKNLERFSTYWYVPFCCVFLGCCAAEFANSGGTYELPCIIKAKGGPRTDPWGTHCFISLCKDLYICWFLPVFSVKYCNKLWSIRKLKFYSMAL
jgi:hypothetical protein